MYGIPLVTYMNPDPAEVFPEDITVTSTSPGLDPAGIVTVISVEDTTFTLDAGVEPKFTEDSPERSVPMIVAVPPPARGEESGVIEMIVGAVGAVVRITV